MLSTLRAPSFAAVGRLPAAPTTPAAPQAPRPTRRAPLRWRARNWLRMLRTGEHLIPLVPLAVRLARSRFVRAIPIVGSVIAGSLGAITVTTAELYGVVTHADGTVEDYGLLGRHLVVTAGKNFLASCMDNTAEPENLKYHGYGTGTTAAASGDTALQTELTTQYATDNTRPTGSQAHSTNTYTTVATLSPDTGGTIAVTEWGLLSQASNAGGTLFDRQVFSAVNLVAGSDSLQTTYVLTFS